VVVTDDEPALDGRLTERLPNAKERFLELGTRFLATHAVVQLCCPARVSLYTGQYAHNHGVQRNSIRAFDPTESIATELSAVGYRTAFYGKYGNSWGGCRGEWCAPRTPPGWDRFVAFNKPSGDGGAYYQYELTVDGTLGAVVGGSAPEDYSTDVLADMLIKDIESAPKGQPAFRWFSPFAPHGKRVPAPRHATDPRCDGIEPWEPPNKDEADVSDKHPSIAERWPTPDDGPGPTFEDVCRTLLSVDDALGRAVAALKARGELKNTVIIWIGDNGVHFGEHRVRAKARPWVTEVPLMVSWIGGMGTTPREVPWLAASTDIPATLCALAGCVMGPYPGGRKGPNGLDLNLRGGPDEPDRDAFLVEMRDSKGEGNSLPTWHEVFTTSKSPLARSGCAAAAQGGCLWRLIEWADGFRELYDASGGPCWSWKPGDPGDPCLMESRAGDPAYAAIEAALHDRLAELEAE
jgi:arylsulfatase A-like enzyme